MMPQGLIENLRKKTFDALDITKKDEEKGLELHKKSIVFDSLSPGDPMVLSNRTRKIAEEGLEAKKSFSEIWWQLYNRSKQIDDLINEPETRRKYASVWDWSGVTAANISIMPDDTFDSAVQSVSNFLYKLEQLQDIVIKATSVKDVKKAKQEGKHAIFWNFQNTLVFGGGEDLERELNRINFFYRLGIRAVQLTYNLRNFVGDGCTERYQSGLSYYGLKVVERMNHLGILVDVSHCGSQTTLDAVEASKDPIAATHVGCKDIYFHNRNKTDEEMRAIAEKGGYVGILREQPFIGGRATIKEVLDHIDYAVDLIGIDHVGIGTDREYYPYHPRILEMLEHELKYPSRSRSFWSGWRSGEIASSLDKLPEMDTSELVRGSVSWINWPYFTVGLVSRGYSDKEIQKIIGGNFMKIMERVVG